MLKSSLLSYAGAVSGIHPAFHGVGLRPDPLRPVQSRQGIRRSAHNRSSLCSRSNVDGFLTSDIGPGPPTGASHGGGAGRRSSSFSRIRVPWQLPTASLLS